MTKREKIQMNVFCVENDPNYELSYFDVKEANDQAEADRVGTSLSIQSMRVFLESKLTFEYNVSHSFKGWKESSRNARILSRRYYKQMKNKSRF